MKTSYFLVTSALCSFLAFSSPAWSTSNDAMPKCNKHETGACTNYDLAGKHDCHKHHWTSADGYKHNCKWNGSSCNYTNDHCVKE